mmetsp:Transcript_21480/g.34756  ORF Transcript_21480/g.34756 Transcript_21480/m.34756 type:complete len:593 (+) Transcript_21480:200-1978(+)
MACQSQALVVARARTRGAVQWERSNRHTAPLARTGAAERRKRRAWPRVTVKEAAHRADAGFPLSNRDYPEGEVILGMELRMHSLKAAPVDTANAEFQRPGVSVKMDVLSEQSVKQAVTKVIDHFHWKGPVGVSVTRAITRLLNQAAPKAMEEMMPNSKGKVVTMIHTEAAAYAEMYFGPGREVNGVVVVVTIGKGMGTVTYNMGQKVRNSDLTHLTWTYERELSKLQQRWGWSGWAPALPADKDRIIQRVLQSSPTLPMFQDSEPPDGVDCSQDEEESAQAVFAWAGLVDRYLQKISTELKPERIILLTTGAAAYLPEEFLLPLFRPAIAAAGLHEGVLVVGASPERALVAGAAVGAHIELGRRQAAEIFRAAVTETITGSPNPREIYDEDLLWVFSKKLDRDKDGVLSHSDLAAGSMLLNTSLSDAEVTGLLRDLTGGLQDTATVEQFKSWFQRMLTLASARVHEVHSAAEFDQIVDEAQHKLTVMGELAEEGSLVVLECAYTHCRPCMRFERAYEGVASKYVDSVFLKVVGDGSPGAAHLCRDVLEVQGTPEFRFYRGKKLLHVMRGADRTKLEESVKSFLRAGEIGNPW